MVVIGTALEPDRNSLHMLDLHAVDVGIEPDLGDLHRGSAVRNIRAEHWLRTLAVMSAVAVAANTAVDTDQEHYLASCNQAHLHTSVPAAMLRCKWVVPVAEGKMWLWL